MKEIDSFLTYLFEDIDAEYIHLFKRIKHGSKYYYLNISTEQEFVGKGVNSYSDIGIVLDVTGNCIELSSSADLQIVTIEDKELVNKWVNIFEEHLSQRLEQDVLDVLSTSLQNTKSKSILRDYKLNKFDNESI